MPETNKLKSQNFHQKVCHKLLQSSVGMLGLAIEIRVLSYIVSPRKTVTRPCNLKTLFLLY